ncbi:MAG: endopeptidase La [Desulfobacteraceae bacterium 4572_35.1]|nr:MAG: endopeptidase La [Desulfobacteraceae bacterium 4572_35.1]
MTHALEEIEEVIKGAGAIPLLPLRDIVIFPEMVTPLFVGRPASIRALDVAMEGERLIFLVAQNDSEIDEPEQDDIYPVGTIAKISQLLKLPDGTVKLLVEGQCRAQVDELIEQEDYIAVTYQRIEEVRAGSLESEALVRSVRSMFKSYVALSRKVPSEVVSAVENITVSGLLADTVAAHLSLRVDEKQEILELVDISARLETLLELMEREVEILKIERKIRKRVKSQMERTQKEYYLNEQMRAIQKELGDKDDFKQELKDIEEKIAKKKMSREATNKVETELRKLKMMSPMSAEATVVRNYIDWLLDLPWQKSTRDSADLEHSENILNADHYGLEKVKERILEHLAVQTLVKKIKGPILCLVGPPGVGKTSLGRSIAHAVNRKFVRISLGGVRDEAEIRGHRRTYIGAMPGKIIQSMKKVGVRNPVFLLDEIDKMATDFRGDPSAALLEVLDPEQNRTFGDHFLDLDYDLSHVMFVTTANSLQDIPAPLLDRMEIVQLEGYCEEEKVQIARNHLLDKQLIEHGLTAEQVVFTQGALTEIIRRYTRESGVRDLERRIAAICRKIARQMVVNDDKKSWRVGVAQVHKYLSAPVYSHGKKDQSSLCGVATGLAWTAAGGEILMIEVLKLVGQGKLNITGKLGEVMQESAQAAFSYVRSRWEELGLEEDFYRNVDLHIHVPEGAIPKDGPSAGITIATALASALTGRLVDSALGMTGEINLRGEVLPIGGLKEKILAARRAGLGRILIPAENKRQLDEIPAYLIKELEIVCVGHMDEVLAQALL